jgi:hypothetical protein
MEGHSGVWGAAVAEALGWLSVLDESVSGMSLPQPDDLTSLVVRTDFGNDTAWEVVRAAVDGGAEYRHATYVSDRAYEGVTAQELVEVDAAADDADKLTYLFLADEVTMTEGEHLLLALDLHDEPGRSFRVPPRWFSDVSANLCIANTDFCEFADAADESGIYRGSEGD